MAAWWKFWEKGEKPVEETLVACAVCKDAFAVPADRVPRAPICDACAEELAALSVERKKRPPCCMFCGTPFAGVRAEQSSCGPCVGKHVEMLKKMFAEDCARIFAENKGACACGGDVIGFSGKCVRCALQDVKK